MNLYELAIIGGGPAGVAAGVYAARKRLSTIFISKDFGGQSTVSSDIQNWIGTISISGEKLAENLKSHLTAYSGNILTIADGEYVLDVKKEDSHFVIKTDKAEHKAKTVLITTGSYRRKLEIPGAIEFENKGITYCASCDGPLLADMDVTVIGGGNAAFETASQLLAYAKSVTLLNRSQDFRADPVTVEKVSANPKIKIIKNAEVREVKGDKFVTSLTYRDKTTNNEIEIFVSGVFVEIGLLPNTSFVSHLVALNQYNQIIVDPRTQHTSIEGVWAAGDATDGLYHQNNIAAGDAVKALEDIYSYLHTK